MNNVIKTKWQTLILEMLMVMIGVLLALLVDEWREERQIAEVVELTESRILSEIRENQERLKTYHQGLNERFTKLKQWRRTLEPEKSFRQQANFPGIPTVTLNDAAWSRANSSDMTNFMDQGIIEEAHGLYRTNQVVMTSAEPLLELIYSPLSWDPQQTMTAYHIAEDIFREAISQVEQSLDAYDDFIAVHP